MAIIRDAASSRGMAATRGTQVSGSLALDWTVGGMWWFCAARVAERHSETLQLPMKSLGRPSAWECVGGRVGGRGVNVCAGGFMVSHSGAHGLPEKVFV